MAIEVEVLEQSFALAEPKASLFSAKFYEILFADYPEVQPLFANSNMAEQQKKLFASLELVVNNLRNSEILVSSLKGLGARHVQYGVLPRHYPMVGQAILKTFSDQLGSDWTPAVESAWTEAFGAISELMQDH